MAGVKGFRFAVLDQLDSQTVLTLSSNVNEVLNVDFRLIAECNAALVNDRVVGVRNSPEHRDIVVGIAPSAGTGRHSEGVVAFVVHVIVPILDFRPQPGHFAGFSGADQQGPVWRKDAPSGAHCVVAVSHVCWHFGVMGNVARIDADSDLAEIRSAD